MFPISEDEPPMTGTVLFVHPYGHVFDDFVPMGAVALMNRIPGPKNGRYAWELTEADLHEASVLAMDLHWYFSIEPVCWIARAVRQIRPDLPIVLGGISASFYARHLMEVFEIDYLVQGDGEAAFPPLVDALREGRVPPPLPHVWTRSGPPPTRKTVPPPLYNSNDYLTLDWFPTLEATTRRAHRSHAESPFWGQMDNFHPYIPLNRGCRFPCGGCFGSYQPDVFGFGQVDRNAESFAQLLDRAEADPDFRFVNLTAGTEDMARVRAYRDVFSRKRALSAYVMHFCALPTDDDLALILDGFEKVCIDFTNPSDVPLPLRGSGMSIEDAEQRIVDIALLLDGRPEVRVGISFMDTQPHPFKDRLRGVGWETVSLKENSEWTLPRPSTDLLEAPEGVATDWAIPRTERIGLSSEDLARRERSKAAQAEQFRAVSRRHARYLVARALVPSLHPVFEEAPMQHVDGKPREVLVVHHAPLRAFMDVFTEQFRHWFVRGLAEVVVVVSGITQAADGRTALPTPGRDLGAARVTPSINGMRLHWSGPVEAGTRGLVLRTVMDPGDGSRFDPGELEGLVWRVLPLPAVASHATVEGVVSQQLARLTVTAGDHIHTLEWRPLTDHPSSPFSPIPRATDAEGGPSDLIDAPWPDMRWPSRISRLLDAASRRGMLPGWRARQRRRSKRWVRYAFTDPRGETTDVYFIPPGEQPCVWDGQHLRMVTRGGMPQDLKDKLIPLLRRLDERG